MGSLLFISLKRDDIEEHVSKPTSKSACEKEKLVASSTGPLLLTTSFSGFPGNSLEIR